MASRKLKTSEEIFNQIRWDPKYNVDDFVIGYLDRFEGLKETRMSQWVIKDTSEEEFIPWHRVYYFKQNGLIVWDRKARLNTL